MRDPRTGVLTHPSDATGCIREGGLAGCTPGRNLDGLAELELSPDGKFVYAVSASGIAVLRRDKRTGALRQASDASGCVSADRSSGACTSAVAIDNLQGLAITSDGRFAYGAALNSSAVTAFSRDRRTGGLTQLAGLDACIGEAGGGGICTVGRALSGAQAAIVSRNGNQVYAASFAGVATLDRER